MARASSFAPVHGYLVGRVRAFAEDRNDKAARFYRILNEVPTVLMIGIVVLVIVKPFCHATLLFCQSVYLTVKLQPSRLKPSVLAISFKCESSKLSFSFYHLVNASNPWMKRAIRFHRVLAPVPR